jgi:hypothetical protein
MSVVTVPVKLVNGVKWADLGALGLSHEIVAETGKLKDGSFSFGGNHRVRLWKFKKNVHFKVPEGTDYDITAVQTATPPRRQGHGS